MEHHFQEINNHHDQCPRISLLSSENPLCPNMVKLNFIHKSKQKVRPHFYYLYAIVTNLKWSKSLENKSIAALERNLYPRSVYPHYVLVLWKVCGVIVTWI